MITVITNDKLQKHAVSKYSFKVLSLNQNDDSAFTSALVEQYCENENGALEKEEYSEDNNPNRRESDIDSSAMSKNSKDALIESLMKKTDEMSSNFIKLQMKIESNEEEYKQELEKVKDESFNAGVEAGIKKASEDEEKNKANGLAQFSNSVTTLEHSAKEFSDALESIKKELVSAAIDISKEVIALELSQNSQDVAKVLGDELIKELQSASKITLRVNPKDHGAISEHVGILEKIQIVSDSAVSEGGVIAISDAGNIDSQISKRFQKVKQAALSE
ncbi:MAG: flagellar assembly protein FliH [Sulfurimonas sp.]|nr:flagellar assembly protein FliH [Sulfurimonas sp.]